MICNMRAAVLCNLLFESHTYGQTHVYNHSNAKECDETTGSSLPARNVLKTLPTFDNDLAFFRVKIEPG